MTLPPLKLGHETSKQFAKGLFTMPKLQSLQLSRMTVQCDHDYDHVQDYDHQHHDFFRVMSETASKCKVFLPILPFTLTIVMFFFISTIVCTTYRHRLYSTPGVPPVCGPTVVCLGYLFVLLAMKEGHCIINEERHNKY